MQCDRSGSKGPEGVMVNLSVMIADTCLLRSCEPKISWFAGLQTGNMILSEFLLRFSRMQIWKGDSACSIQCLVSRPSSVLLCELPTSMATVKFSLFIGAHHQSGSAAMFPNLIVGSVAEVQAVSSRSAEPSLWLIKYKTREQRVLGISSSTGASRYAGIKSFPSSNL